MNKISLLIPLSFILALLFGCQSFHEPAILPAGIRIVSAEPESCIFLESRDMTSQPGMYGQDDFQVSILQAGKSIGSTDVYLTEAFSSFPTYSAKANFYTCSEITTLSAKVLENACLKKSKISCMELVKRAKLENNFGNLIQYSSHSCLTGDPASCTWLVEFRKWREVLKSKCLKKDGDSCLTAAVMSDFDNDNVLMMTFLKQGCSYGHNESCFYFNLEEQIRDKIRNTETREERASAAAYRDYVVTTQRQAMSEVSKLMNQIGK